MVLRSDPDAATGGSRSTPTPVRRLAGLPGLFRALRGFMFPGLHVVQPDVFKWMDAEGAYNITACPIPDSSRRTFRSTGVSPVPAGSISTPHRPSRPRNTLADGAVHAALIAHASKKSPDCTNENAPNHDRIVGFLDYPQAL
jgi:hypothetical protein